jgi:hypothetical protein
VATAERVKMYKIDFSFANHLLKFVFIIEFGRQVCDTLLAAGKVVKLVKEMRILGL